jgi:ribosome-binding protein aMBF1 (putative translation factor)
MTEKAIDEGQDQASERGKNSLRLVTLAQARFGDRWQRAVAGQLGKSENQVRRWVSGQYEPEEHVIEDVKAGIRTHISDLKGALNGQRGRVVNSARLSAIAEARFGERWQRAVAAILDKSENQVRRWVSGNYEPGDEIIEQLVKSVLEHIEHLETLLRKDDEEHKPPKKRSRGPASVQSDAG